MRIPKKISIIIACFSMTMSVTASPVLDQSLIRESHLAMARGTRYLLDRQADNGAWAGEPAITALVIQALHLSHNQGQPTEIADALEKGREFVLQHRLPNGAFFGIFQPYLNYTTSVSIAALSMLDRPEDEELMSKARHFLMNLQLREEHEENPTSPDNPFYGGIGYGSGGPSVPDLSNTQFAIEALYLTEHLGRDTEFAEKAQATWTRALQYLEEVQNIPENADAEWRPDPENVPEYDGGFVYRPDQCRVREKLTREFEGQPISYGATTMGGLKSLLYADTERDDPRVQAAVEWIKRNYTLEENPVIGAEAHYYYLWNFAKAMQIYGQETLQTADGDERYWRRDILRQLLEMQQSEGQWLNQESGRYMESIPELTTAYAMIAMQVALGE